MYHYKKLVSWLGVTLPGRVYQASSSKKRVLTHGGSISNGDEMNIVLLTLVEYLGHTNSLVSGLAYDEAGLTFATIDNSC